MADDDFWKALDFLIEETPDTVFQTSPYSEKDLRDD